MSLQHKSTWHSSMFSNISYLTFRLAGCLCVSHHICFWAALFCIVFCSDVEARHYCTNKATNINLTMTWVESILYCVRSRTNIAKSRNLQEGYCHFLFSYNHVSPMRILCQNRYIWLQKCAHSYYCFVEVFFPAVWLSLSSIKNKKNWF